MKKLTVTKKNLIASAQKKDLNEIELIDLTPLSFNTALISDVVMFTDRNGVKILKNRFSKL